MPRWWWQRWWYSHCFPLITTRNARYHYHKCIVGVFIWRILSYFCSLFSILDPCISRVCEQKKGKRKREKKSISFSKNTYGHKMIQISIGGRSKFQCPETNVIQSLVVNAECFIGIFDKLMNRQCGVVRLNNCIGNLMNVTRQCKRPKCLSPMQCNARNDRGNACVRAIRTIYA